MTVEVERRMKSEHLKTELLTNVSHDIKTPLTSIINYVDLLKNQDIASENAKTYVEVLERQSHRLKKAAGGSHRSVKGGNRQYHCRACPNRCGRTSAAGSGGV